MMSSFSVGSIYFSEIGQHTRGFIILADLGFGMNVLSGIKFLGGMALGVARVAYRPTSGFWCRMLQSQTQIFQRLCSYAMRTKNTTRQTCSWAHHALVIHYGCVSEVKEALGLANWAEDRLGSRNGKLSRAIVSTILQTAVMLMGHTKPNTTRESDHVC